jgi:CubicO group peptidase (beta-lactamase class C family)
MKPWVKRSLIAVAVLVATAAAAAGWLLAKALPIGTGFAAKYICSSVFVSGRDDATAFREDVQPVNPLSRLVSYSVDRTAGSVTAHAYGFAQATAIYREGCGCTLVVGKTEAELRRQPIAAPEIRESRLDDFPEPVAGREILEPLPPGIDAARLKKALDAAFAEDDSRSLRKTRAVVVVHGGKLIAERYAPGFSARMPLLGWSMGKSVTNALVGILVGKGKLRLADPAPVPEWRAAGDPRGEITLDQLMRMSSGLEFGEVYLPLTDATRMLYGSADFAAYAAGKPLAGPPDSLWNYSSGTANIISRIVRQAVEKDTPNYYRFLRTELFDKIGMTSAVMEADPSGTFVGSSYTLATARDWARFGLLYLQDGIWQGERILPEGWVAYTTTPAAHAPKGEYGALFWLNTGAASDPAKRLWPSVPSDAYAAQGFQEQKVIVVPSRKLVLVRFGATSVRSAWDTGAFVADVLAALPK